MSCLCCHSKEIKENSRKVSRPRELNKEKDSSVCMLVADFLFWVTTLYIEQILYLFFTFRINQRLERKKQETLSVGTRANDRASSTACCSSVGPCVDFRTGGTETLTATLKRTPV
jgi:hypothetical protein